MSPKACAALVLVCWGACSSDGPPNATPAQDASTLSSDSSMAQDAAFAKDVLVADAPSAGVDPVDASSWGTLPCRNHSDCCLATLRVGCVCDGDYLNVVLYSRAPGAAPAPSPAEGSCLFHKVCSCPRVQARCVSGQCVAKASSSYDSTDLGSYCGDMTLDGGDDPIRSTDDAGNSAPAETSWACMC
jgi:hypothetical protein